MAWIESHQELANHPKTKRLCRILGISTPQAIGHLHLLWWWALDYAQDGNLATFTADDLSDACEWDGDANAMRDALIAAGFIDGEAVHDWDQYGGKYIKKQEQSRARQARYRENHPRYTSPDNALLTRDSNAGDASTGQDRTGQESNPPKPPRGAYTVAFEEFWTAYPRVLNSSKAKAARVWEALSVEDKTAARLGLAKYLACDGWRNGFAPHTTTYLNGRLWEVEPPPARASPSNGTKPEDRRPAIPTLEQVLQPVKSMSPEKLAEWREWRNSR